MSFTGPAQMDANASHSWQVVLQQLNANLDPTDLVAGPTSLQEAQAQLNEELGKHHENDCQDAIGSIASADPYGVGKILWSTVRGLINMGRDYVQIFEDVAEAMETMGMKMRRLNGYRELLGANQPPYLHESLTQVLSGYADFYRSVKLYLSRRQRVIENVKAVFSKTAKQTLVTKSQIHFCITEMDARCQRAMDDAHLARDQAQAGSARGTRSACNFSKSILQN
ncbi:hypothetical protein LTR56_019908 [Elasticomyces elasticus]|nr:hypothetical protein LTR56_019908 [Elasticomyces elasticus]KAK3643405.1 hypothetical protein LTR22_015708 [Elasticomyces elasticus]KAK5755454.1 hypothetical protein LTS12_014439 [Elasticomyces elasticus]